MKCLFWTILLSFYEGENSLKPDHCEVQQSGEAGIRQAYFDG